jgi:RNA polymerase sigma factor (sigma-70 family)
MDERRNVGRGRIPQPRSVDLGALLCQWQATGSHAALEDLIRSATPVMVVVIGRVLGQRGIRDPAAVDDALALVFNHLRRLPGAADGEPTVSPFHSDGGTVAEHGRAYLQRLAHDRAVDIARRCRRRARREAAFSALDDVAVMQVPERAGLAMLGEAADEPDDQEEQFLRREMAGLEPREQQLVRLLIEGKSQAVIAHVLGVCEGTISRMRTRVIAKLQAAIRTRPSAGRAETPVPPARAGRRGRAPASPRRGPPGPSAPA